MSAAAQAVLVTEGPRRYHLTKLVISRFVARRTVKSAAFWALIFGAFVASKASGYATAYPTEALRQGAATTFGSNIGFKMLLGRPEHLEQVAGFAVWNTLMVITLIASIWAYLLATKTLRGEETAGRWELLLMGPTTARRGTANALAGLGASLLVLYGVSAVGFIFAGRLHDVNFGTQAALFFAVVTTIGAAMFMAVGALMSQIMPTRSRAASAATIVFGLAFLVRAMADSTTASWLLNLSPLGWIEKMRPLYASDAVWLLPCLGLIAICVALTIFLAGRRDLGDSLVADRDTAKPRTRLLATPLGLALRLNRGVSLAWVGAVAFLCFFFGSMAKTAAQAFSGSQQAEKILTKIAHSGVVAQQTVMAETFLSIAFLMAMVVIMCYTASAMGAVREDEAEGYLDNLLVRKVGRLQWLGGRVLLALGVVVLGGVLAGLLAWAGQATQHMGLSFAVMLKAGLNVVAPAAFTLGIGIFALGFLPRLTSVLAYSVVAWAFLVLMISSGVSLNHWILDTSILQHVALAPAVAPNWTADAMLVALGALAGMLGAWRFRARDLQNE